MNLYFYTFFIFFVLHFSYILYFALCLCPLLSSPVNASACNNFYAGIKNNYASILKNNNTIAMFYILCYNKNEGDNL